MHELEKALLEACRDGDETAVQELVNKKKNLFSKVNVNVIGDDGWTPLLISIKTNNTNISNVLKKHGAVLNRSYLGQGTLLQIAAKAGHTDVVAELIKNKADIDSESVVISAAFNEAIMAGHTDIAKMMLDNGAKVSMFNYAIHIRALIKHNHRDVIELLVKNGVDPNYKYSDRTLLYLACEANNLDIMKVLVAAGADINMTSVLPRTDTPGTISLISIATSGYWTPLHLAANLGHTDIVDYLIQNRANVNVGDSWKWTALHQAVVKGHKEIVKLLLEAGANPNVRNADSNTPLHWAASEGRTEIAEMLIDHGANITSIGRLDYTPLQYAKTFGHRQTEELIKSKLDKKNHQ